MSISCLLLFVACFQTILAQVDTTQKMSTKELEEFVFSANSVAEKRANVAQQIETLTAKQIANSQSQTTADLIASTGQVAVQRSQQGGGSPVIRGFEASRIVLVVDGIRMNNIIYRSGHLQNILTVDNSQLDRVEILFGPASTTYGSDALGGAICFYTKRPLLSLSKESKRIKANSFYRYSAVNNESTGHFDFNIGGEKWASLSSFTYSKFDDLRAGSNPNPFYKTSYGERPSFATRIQGRDSVQQNPDRFLQVQSGYSQYDLMQKLLYQQNEFLNHQLTIQYSNSSDIPRYDRLSEHEGKSLRFAEWYYGPQMRLLTAYDLTRKRDSSYFQLVHLNLNFQNLEESRVTRKFASPYLDKRTENVNIVGANFNVQRKSLNQEIRLGIDLQYNTLKSTAKRNDIEADAIAKLDTRYPDGANVLYSVGIYFSHSWQFAKRFLLTDAVRVGYSSLTSTFSDTSFFPFPFKDAKQNNPVYSGSLGLINAANDKLKISLLASSGYRVPNVDDLAKVFESAAGKVIVPNITLKPEKTISTELGLSYNFRNNNTWQNTVYYTRFFDAIVNDIATYNGQDSIFYNGTLSAVYSNQNKRRAYIYGFSSVLTTQINSHFALNTTLTYTYGRIKTDSIDVPLDHIPPLIGRLSISYENKNFAASFFVNYNAWKKIKDYKLNGEDNEQYATPEGMPAWFTANFRVSYKFIKYLSIQAGIDNILDTQYRTFASGINAPGRNVFAALRFTY
jgi:hemoglobin/transferrin/lactoferrin receptor protein